MYLEDGSPELKILKLLPSSPGLTPLSGTLSNPTSEGLRSESPPKSQASVSPHLALPETPQVLCRWDPPCTQIRSWPQQAEH